MEYVRVYRVEHSTANLGPYRLYKRDDLRTQELYKAHNDSDYHPGMYTDFGDTMSSIYYTKLYKCHCGFDSIEDLDIWFDGFQEKLAKKGFVIKVYRVKYTDVHYGRSGRQIMFPRPLFPVGVLKLNSNHERVY